MSNFVVSSNFFLKNKGWKSEMCDVRLNIF